MSAIIVFVQNINGKVRRGSIYEFYYVCTLQWCDFHDERQNSCKEIRNDDTCLLSIHHQQSPLLSKSHKQSPVIDIFL